MLKGFQKQARPNVPFGTGGAAMPISIEVSTLQHSLDLLHKKTLHRYDEGFLKTRRRHTLPQYSSTICANGLNFSVRNGKR